MRVTNPIGKKGEDIAATFLRQKGYQILDRNFQGRQGEIDIIAKKDSVLVFVEVKTRRSAQFGTPFEATSHTKLSSLLITAQLYVSQHNNLPEAQRVDAIGVELGEDGKVTNIEHIENISGF